MEYKLPKLPTRPRNSNKGTFGKVLNIAGSEFMPGAAYLSSLGALKVGAGYVQLVSDISVLKTVASLAPEIVLSDDISKIKSFKEYRAIIFGCGCDESSQTVDYLNYIVNNMENIPLVIDADGINVLSKNYFKLNNNVILTPHPKEASRLLDCSLDDVLNDIENSAKRISEKYHCITVLKTYKTIVTDGKILYHNMSGCSALAKAGSGDVLAGMIGGFLAQGMRTFDAAVLGVYLHGLTGEIAAKNLSEYGVLASDLLKYIPFALLFHNNV